MAQDNIACFLYGPGKVRYRNKTIPTLKDPHDVLVQISYVGVCGSDVHFWMHGGVSRKVSEDRPLVMGHEASGIVHAVGPAVTKLTPGDRVAIEPGFPCRRCHLCKSGRYNLCPKMRFAADPPHTHGTLCRYFRIPDDFVYKIPESLSLQEAVLMEPLSVAIHGVRLADLRPTQTVLVMGSGTIGLLVAATAMVYGAKAIYIADTNESKLEFAKRFVPSRTFVPSMIGTPEEDAARFKDQMLLENGADVVLECTGVERAAQTGLYAAAVGATFVQIGMGQAVQQIPLLAMCEKEVVLKTSFRYGAGDYDIALDLLKSGKLSVKPLISSEVSFDKATDAWERTRKGIGIKNLIRGPED